MWTLEELKNLLINNYTPEELTDLLGLSSEDLVSAHVDIIEERFEDITELMKYDSVS